MDGIVRKEKFKELPDSKPVCMEKILKKQSVHITKKSVAFNEVVGKREKTEATIKLKKNEDIIESIEVICPCGNKIEILCQYD